MHFISFAYPDAKAVLLKWQIVFMNEVYCITKDKPFRSGMQQVQRYDAQVGFGDGPGNSYVINMVPRGEQAATHEGAASIPLPVQEEGSKGNGPKTLEPSPSNQMPNTKPLEMTFRVEDKVMFNFMLRSFMQNEAKELSQKLNVDCKIIKSKQRDNFAFILQCKSKNTHESAEKLKRDVLSRITESVRNLSLTKVTVGADVWPEFKKAKIREELNAKVYSGDVQYMTDFDTSDCSYAIAGVAFHVDNCQKKLDRVLRGIVHKH
ncbi:hypothetical protein CAPTEDRAFT_224484 [Capitella teleta]|uniref:Uncharacterized protein n=1 Tax=Capitella teleta TaxID=283909 RepID=R7T904_CAPTE|nr:hypothetical protein CAPTEDRAFT_224484 [Capitella teleta]|eukprot:ELT89908.1 hypothetical protein CAPTEDRAFT_224484 [Capitella teleta]